jgi:hypothetical protein
MASGASMTNVVIQHLRTDSAVPFEWRDRHGRIGRGHPGSLD